VPTHLGDLEVHELAESSLDGADIVFFASGAANSRRHAPGVAASGGVAIDKSSAYRMDPDVPLVVPEVNAETLGLHHGIVANPNCVAIPLSIVLAPLRRAYGLRRVTVATYQAASGAGLGLADELQAQLRDDAAGTAPVAHVYPHVLHANVVPGGWTMQGDDTEEEVKVIGETRRVLAAPDLRMSVTTVRVPVAVGHSAAVWVELNASANPDEVRALLREPPGSTIRCREPSPAPTTSRWGASVATPERRTASHCFSAPTTYARARRPMPSRLRSCCSANVDGSRVNRPGTPRAVH
jgi:aspartate-semialdehyde dehydrogenase